MCGIAGLAGFSPETLGESLPRMLERLIHRGPDDEGVAIHGRCALGIRRLSIIDLQTGHQPMANEDGTVLCVENGEIYNYVELREGLLRSGHRFRSRSDSEVLVHLYEEEGPEFVRRLRGMFAIAVLDTRSGELILARDALGEKPLFYAETGPGLVFASEIDALLACGLVSREPDPEGLDELLTLGYALAPRTAFRHVRRLPPGHLLRRGDGGIRIQPFWSLSPDPPRPVPEPEARERFQELLQDSLRLRLRSDVPVGAFLSGGLDSSLMVALLAQLAGEPVRTFNIRFARTSLDESAWARQVADRYGTRHEVIEVSPGEAGALVDGIVAHYGEPFADASAIPTWLLSQAAARQVKVVMGGDGGDELVAGYSRYQGERFARLWGHLPVFLRRGVLRAFTATTGSAGVGSTSARVCRVLAAAQEDPAGRYLSKSQILPLEFWRRLQGKAGPAEPAGPVASPAGPAADTAARQQIEAVLGAVAAKDWVGRLGALDMLLYLPSDMLHKVDIASMAHGLEVRLPYLDLPLVEYCASLPGDLKLQGWTRKFLLRRVAEPLLPPGLIRRPKQGFTVPLDSWFAHGLYGVARERLLSPDGAADRFVDRRAMESWMTRDGAHGRSSQALWSLLMLDAWVRRYC